MDPNEKELIAKLFPYPLFEKERIESDFQANDFDLFKYMENLTFKTMSHIKNNEKTTFMMSPSSQKNNESDNFTPIPNFHKHSKLLFHLFDMSMHKLHEMYGNIIDEAEQLKEETKTKLKDQKDVLTELSGDLEEIGKGFRSLEDFMNQVGNTTVQIGTALEQLDIQKQKAIETKKILNYFTEFNKYEEIKFRREILSGRKVLKFDVFRDPSRKLEAVRVLKQLYSLSEDLKTTNGCENGVANISGYHSFILERMLREFSSVLVDSIDTLVVKDLSQLSQLFYEFEAIRDCERLYTSRRFDIFLGIEEKEFESFAEDETNEAMANKPVLSLKEDLKIDITKDFNFDDSDDSDEEEGKTNEDVKTEEEEKLDKLYQQKKIDKHALETKIKQLRNKKIAELGDSIKSIKKFEELLQNIEKTLLDEAEIIKVVFPHTFQETASNLLKQFLRLIKSFLNSGLMKPPPAISQYLNFLNNLDNVNTLVNEFIGRIFASDLPFNKDEAQQEIDILFSEKKSIYSQMEIKYLNNNFELTLNEPKFRNNFEFSGDSSRTKEKKKPKNLFASVESVGLPFGMFERAIDFESVSEIIRENSTALQRCKRLLDGKDSLPVTSKDIFFVLKNFILRYVKEGIETGQQKIIEERNHPSEESCGEKIFEIINSTSAILQKLQRHYEVEVVPLVSTNIQASNECVQVKEELFTFLETKVVAILKDTYINLCTYADNILSTKQKKNDYYSTGNSIQDESFTIACSEWCNFVSMQIGYICNALIGENREQFLTVFGNQLFKNLIHHLTNKIGTISSESPRFLRDMNQYYQCSLKFQIEKVEKQFKVLTVIGKIVMMQPENIGELIKNFDLSQISKQDLIMILKLRSDAKQLKNLQYILQ